MYRSFESCVPALRRWDNHKNGLFRTPCLELIEGYLLVNRTKKGARQCCIVRPFSLSLEGQYLVIDDRDVLQIDSVFHVGRGDPERRYYQGTVTKARADSCIDGDHLACASGQCAKRPSRFLIRKTVAS